MLRYYLFKEDQLDLKHLKIIFPNYETFNRTLYSTVPVKDSAERTL